ncbi:MAG: phosphate ABC transporter permease PstA [Myxococcales bacterium]|nr:phosphate ABC transporter permease PstA [Myxococcales bacterium]
MTSADGNAVANNAHSSERSRKRRAKRHAREKWFRAVGVVAISVALGALALLVGTVTVRGVSGFSRHVVTLEFDFDRERLEIDPAADLRAGQLTDAQLRRGNFEALVKETLRESYPEVSGRRERRALSQLVSSAASFRLREALLENPEWLDGRQSIAVPLSAEADMVLKGAISRESPESERSVSDAQIAWLDGWIAEGRVNRVLNRDFFTAGDSRDPELAGIWGAMVGTFWSLLIALLLSFPVGVAAAVHLEEFAKKNRFNDFIEVNINNLAAVPSIVFGLLGLAVFLNFFGLPRSAPLVGGMVLSLLTLPVVIIASRSAIAAVPPSIREAALGMGASRLQVVAHHVLPLAMPGILTGTIIGMARALGETAPLLMIGMVAFVVDVAEGPLSPSTALPVQIFLWADSPERAFVEKTSAAILVLLAFLVAMNLAAVLLRNRFERRW